MTNLKPSQLDRTRDELNDSFRNNPFVRRDTEPKYSIVRELNPNDLPTQDKEIEIERLQTTCANLSSVAAITEDLKAEVIMLKRRLEESERERDTLEKSNQVLTAQVSSLKQDFQTALD